MPLDTPVGDRSVEGDTRRRLGTLVAAGAVLLVIAWLVSTWIGPRPPSLAAPSGDPELADRVEQALADDQRGLDVMVVAELSDGEVRVAGFGTGSDGEPVDGATSFEIGSVAKPLTGMLVAELIERGELAENTTIADLVDGNVAVDVGDSAGSATVARLASHRAGYPRLPLSTLPRGLLARLQAGDPYTGDTEAIIDAATADSGTSHDFTYSNLGMAVLGDAIALDRGTSYDALLTELILGPLGMSDTAVVSNSDELPAVRAAGREAASGRGADPWLAEGWQPMGVGMWSTASDLAMLMGAALDGTAPGQASTEPRFEAGSDRMIGFGWFTSEIDGITVTSHNGGTGGFRSWVGMAPGTGRGVIVLSNTTRPVDPLGEHLLVRRSGSLDGRSIPLIGWFMFAFTVLGTAVPAFAAVAGKGGGTDRQSLIGAVASAVAALGLTRVLGPWDVVTTAPWVVGAALTGAAIVGSIVRWPSLPAARSDHPRLRWLSTGLSVIFALVVVIITW